MAKHIIFDFGGVFLDLKGKHTGIPSQLSKIFNISEESAAEIWKENKEKLLIGQETPKEFLARIIEKHGFSANPDEAYKLWEKNNKMEKSDINWDLVDYVESLKGKYKIHMLTDTIDLDNGNSEWFSSITKHFENIYKSFEIGHKKPNKEAFLYVLQKITAKPEECIFVDDLAANVDSANKLGIKGLLYTNLDQLKRDLEPQ